MTNTNSHTQETQKVAEGSVPKSVRRTLLGTPAALIVTAGLGLLMAGMIRVEYEALAEKPEQLSFTINEEVPDIEITRITELPILRTVETPPPPPVIDTIASDEPKIDRVELEVDPPIIDKPDVVFELADFEVSDRDAQPIFRPEPIIPPRFMEGDNSGHCTVRFDVSAQGSPYNVVATYCTTRALERATIKSVLKWKFRPKVVKGEDVAMTGVENRVTFRLLDERGNLLPEI